MPWNTDENGDENGKVTIKLPDGEVEVDAGTNFVDTLKEVAREQGYGKFKTFLDGNELLSPDDAPETISSDHKIRIEPLDKGN